MPHKSKATDPWAALRAALVVKGTRPPGTGWKTRKELGVFFRCGKVRLTKTVRELLQQGKLEKFIGSLPVGNGPKTAPMIWYRPVQKR